ncbi:BPL-N domain-containing protein [Singulisphaera rosea]
MSSESTWSGDVLGPQEIRAGDLASYDVVLFPGGRATGQLHALGNEGRDGVRRFVAGGGGFVGICAGGFLATQRYLDLANVEVLTGDRIIPGVGLRSIQARGPGQARIELTEAGESILGGVPKVILVEFAGGPIFIETGKSDRPTVLALARYLTELADHEAHRGTMIQTPSMIATRFGEGRVIAFSPHPERLPASEILVKAALRSAARPPSPTGSQPEPAM